MKILISGILFTLFASACGKSYTQKYSYIEIGKVRFWTHEKIRTGGKVYEYKYLKILNFPEYVEFENSGKMTINADGVTYAGKHVLYGKKINFYIFDKKIEKGGFRLLANKS